MLLQDWNVKFFRRHLVWWPAHSNCSINNFYNGPTSIKNHHFCNPQLFPLVDVNSIDKKQYNYFSLPCRYFSRHKEVSLLCNLLSCLILYCYHEINNFFSLEPANTNPLSKKLKPHLLYAMNFSTCNLSLLWPLITLLLHIIEHYVYVDFICVPMQWVP